MRRLHKFLRLPWAERCLLVRAVIVLGAMRLGLWLLPFQTLRRFLAPVGRAPDGLRKADTFFPDRLAWAVAAASRYVPSATCLAQALTVQVLLAGAGYDACLRIGVSRTDEGQFQAHAWVESRGRIVIGGSDIGHYTGLLRLERETP